jgi:hypothetical protein
MRDRFMTFGNSMAPTKTIAKFRDYSNDFYIRFMRLFLGQVLPPIQIAALPQK